MPFPGHRIAFNIMFEDLTIAGEAPIAQRAFAIRSMDTKFVMQWTRGFFEVSNLRCSRQ